MKSQSCVKTEMGHRCCSKQEIKRGLWSPEEDEKLIYFITSNGHRSWSSVPKLAGLQRCGKSCRLRWVNYLRPDLKRGSFTPQEVQTIIELHRNIGNKWAQIAKQLPGRTDNEVKNFWNTCIRKKLISQGMDPKSSSHNQVISSDIGSSTMVQCSITQPIFNPMEMNLPGFASTPSPLLTSTQPSTLIHQNPNDIVSFRCGASSLYSFGFSDPHLNGKNCCWGSNTVVEPIDVAILEEMEMQRLKQQQQEGTCQVEMDESFDRSIFDFELLESTLMSMDDLEWNF